MLFTQRYVLIKQSDSPGSCRLSWLRCICYDSVTTGVSRPNQLLPTCKIVISRVAQDHCNPRPRALTGYDGFTTPEPITAELSCKTVIGRGAPLPRATESDTNPSSQPLLRMYEPRLPISLTHYNSKRPKVLNLGDLMRLLVQACVALRTISRGE